MCYREEIQVPRGGVGALPPSFLVNQLLDLMARQRREVIPKCGIHPSQELLFCESCDAVFCSHCTNVSHGAPMSNVDARNSMTTNRSASASSSTSSSSSSSSSASCSSSTSSGDHTVVPFSIAIKRMSEILLYKANEVATKVRLLKDARWWYRLWREWRMEIGAMVFDLVLVVADGSCCRRRKVCSPKWSVWSRTRPRPWSVWRRRSSTWRTACRRPKKGRSSRWLNWPTARGNCSASSSISSRRREL